MQRKNILSFSLPLPLFLPIPLPLPFSLPLLLCLSLSLFACCQNFSQFATPRKVLSFSVASSAGCMLSRFQMQTRRRVSRIAAWYTFNLVLVQISLFVNARFFQTCQSSIGCLHLILYFYINVDLRRQTATSVCKIFNSFKILVIYGDYRRQRVAISWRSLVQHLSLIEIQL